MEENKESDKVLLPHHIQQSLCTTRLPYRQGRKLTAVKIQDDTADLHGVSQPFISKTCKKVAEAIARISHRFIKMPTTLTEQQEAMQKFRRIANFPTVIGAIDCTHIKIKKLSEDGGQLYINRKGFSSINVQVYSVTKESNHLLVFGVPSLNLRQETKALFMKFGKLLQFNISTQHAAEPFTETYHAQYDKPQQSRLAKRMLDTKNFYGGILHVCYAPELETTEETRQKLIQRQRDVVYRLKNLQKEVKTVPEIPVPSNSSNATCDVPKKLDMGQINTISIGKQIREVVYKKKDNNKRLKRNNDEKCVNSDKNIETSSTVVEKPRSYNFTDDKEIEVVDCTNIDSEVVTNINESLNYNKFGNELIRKVPDKPLNKIQFHINKKS